MKFLISLLCLFEFAHAGVSGRIELEGQKFLKSLDKKSDESAATLRLLPAASAKRKDISFKFTASGEATTAQRHLQGFIQDLFIRKDAGDSIFTLGFNTYSWGVTDGYNPLDVINPRDFTNPLHAKKMGSFGLHMSQTLSSSLQIEALYIPVQTASRLPAERSRWLPRRIFLPASSDIKILLPDHVNYSIRENEDLYALHHNMGARLLFTEGSREWGLIFFDGMSSTPIIRADVVATAVNVSSGILLALNPNIAITPVYYRVQTTGASLVWSFDSVIMRLQSAYTHVRSKSTWGDLPTWSQENIWALEKTSSLGHWSFTGLLQGTYNIRPKNSGSSSGLTELLDRAVMVGLRASPNLSWESYIFAGMDTKGQGSLIGASISHTMTERTKLELRGDFLHGPDTSWVGSYRDNDEIFLTFSYLL